MQEEFFHNLDNEIMRWLIGFLLQISFSPRLYPSQLLCLKWSHVFLQNPKNTTSHKQKSHILSLVEGKKSYSFIFKPWKGWSTSGDGGLAVSSSLFRPSGVAVDGPNRVAYVATGHHRLRRVELSSNGGRKGIEEVSLGSWACEATLNQTVSELGNLAQTAFGWNFKLECQIYRNCRIHEVLNSHIQVFFY